MTVRPTSSEHLQTTLDAMQALGTEFDRLERWGAQIATVLAAGGRLLAAGNGGSAAQAQHLTAELVGRYLGDRRPLSAIALHADTSSVTAIANDFGRDAVFARQVEAHGRPGDVLILLSTSGRSSNILAAAASADRVGLTVLALTGPRPNPLADCCDDLLAVQARSSAGVQEVHLVALHLVCNAVDAALEGDGVVGHGHVVAQ